MEQLYPKSTRWEKTIVGAFVFFLLFCNYQDTESESQDMEIGIAGPILTQKNINGFMGQCYQ